MGMGCRGQREESKVRMDTIVKGQVKLKNKHNHSLLLVLEQVLVPVLLVLMMTMVL